MPYIAFDIIYKEFEKTNNVCQFCRNYSEDDVATRFLLIRSLDKPGLKYIVTNFSDQPDDGNFETLTKKAFESSVTIPRLLEYIESKRAELIRAREAELDGLSDVLADFPIVHCGVRNDRIDDIVKAFVRNKSLKTKDELFGELDNSLLPRIRQYSLWSYFNQTSNDIIELFFLKNPAVIPTLRKIHDIDFFIKIDNKIVPFDLKFTHISDSYFDLASQGISRDNSEDIYDDFTVNESSETNELKRIKAFYRQLKRSDRQLNLPNYGGLSKIELLDLLSGSGNQSAEMFVREITEQHKNYVPTNAEELFPLEWWNYKYQGERLFCNNNRLFVFLAYTDKFVDGRELKGKTAEIGQKINELLDDITSADIHTVHYHYDKDAALVGDYEALSLSTIYYE